MLRTDLLDLVNHGDMWAFIGSGAFVDSGCPTWSGLVQVVLKNVQDDERKAIQAHGQFAAANKAGNDPKIFSIIEKIIERDKLEAAVKTEIKKAGPPRQLAQLIADWPFAAYITTN